MATFKHISSKNADYSAAEAYLTFEHDEFTMRATLDENGRLIPREDYRISTLNCGDEDFAISCMRANLRYGKNQKREDVKSHHYIISFDPKDVPDHGLTVDMAQELGEKFCAEHFPGHQALVCTHPGGHSHSGNIHVHIVINSLRIAEVPFMPYMDRPCDTQPGMKHRCTNAAMEYFRSEVMEMCHSAGLYQIDLLNGSKTRVTEREYWVKKKDSLRWMTKMLLLLNRAYLSSRANLKRIRTSSDRKSTRHFLMQPTLKILQKRLLRRGITVKESRGRLSYLTPDRTKPITARKLGDDFDKVAVLAALDKNAQRTKMPIAPKHTSPSTQNRVQQQNTVSRMVDIEAKRVEGKGQGYIHWAKLHNLKNGSKAFMMYKDMGFESPEELDAAYQEAHEKMTATLAKLKSNEAAIAEKKELRTHVLSYFKTKDIREGLKACKNEKARCAYREEHDSDFIILDAAKRYFDSKGLKKLPSYKALQAQIEQLIKEKNALYNEYHEAKNKDKELGTVCHNIDQILNGELTRKQEQKKKSQEQEI